MRLLLDTHIWFWSLAEPSQIAKRIANKLENAENEIWLSPISIWELMMLAEKRRVTLDSEPKAWIRDALQRFSVIEAPLNNEIAIESRSIVLPHQDPADRFLAATARIYDLTLVTSDARLLGSKSFLSIANK